MIIMAAIISCLLALIKYNDARSVTRYTLKLFAYLVGSVIVFSWIMHIV